MNVGKISSLSFGKVYAIAGNKKDIGKVREKVANKPKDEVCFVNATKYYREHEQSMPFSYSNAVKRGQRVGIVLTGKDALMYRANKMSVEDAVRMNGMEAPMSAHEALSEL